MNKLLLSLLCTSTLLLSGCPRHAAQSSGLSQSNIKSLVLIHTEKLPRITGFLEFSGNGSTFVVAGMHHFIRVYDTTTLEQRVAIQANDKLRHLLAVQGAGYIDENTWYFATIDYSGDVQDASISIRRIEPPGEIFKYHTDGFSSGRPVLANKNHITHDGILLDWHNDNTYEVLQAHGGRHSYEMTPDSQVVTQTVDGNTVLFHNPVTDERMVWRIGSGSFTLSPDANYAVIASNRGKCELWRLPQKEQVGVCGRGGLFDKGWPLVTFSRDNQQFAITVGDDIVAYAMQPFKQIAAVTMSEPVYALALDGHRLAATGVSGAVRVWSIGDSAPVGQYTPRVTMSEQSNTRQYNFLAFQPNGNKLVAVQSTQLMVFDLVAPPLGDAVP